MELGTALLIVALLLVGATALGFVVRARNSRVARGCGADEHSLAVDGAEVTLVQLSSPVCSACVAMRRVFGEITAADPTVAHREIDVVDEAELAQRHSVYSTPTTLVLDAQGRVRSRIIGAVRPDAVHAAIDAARRELVSA